MATQPFETRLSAVEQTLLELAQAQARTQVQIDRTQAQIDRTQAQLDQLGAENRAFHADTQVFQAETRAFRADIRTVVDRMADQSAATERRMDERLARSERRWGELANKMGTLTEDIVLPGIPTVFRTFFAETGAVEPAVRVRRQHRAEPGRMEEFDAVARGGEVVLIAESKSTLRPEYLGEFRDKLARSRDFLPEAAGRRVVGLLASFYLDPSLIAAGERQGLIMVGLGSGLLQVLNTPGFVPAAF